VGEVRAAARRAEGSRPLRALARGGYAANGLVHCLIGIIALVVAAGGPGEGDQVGAFRAIAEAPLGFLALWAVAILLWGLGVWHAAAGVGVIRRSDVKEWGIRVAEFGQAIVFLALGGVGAAVALGSRPDPDESAEDASRGVLAVPGGALLLGAVALGILVGGAAFLVMGVRRSYRNKVALPPGAAGHAVSALGVVGFVAKGIALAIIGILLLVAAVRVEPDAAGGLDGALDALLGLPLGPVLVGTVGVGLCAYGVFCGFRARYARL
jgi:hypothetical protein